MDQLPFTGAPQRNWLRHFQELKKLYRFTQKTYCCQPLILADTEKPGFFHKPGFSPDLAWLL